MSPSHKNLQIMRDTWKLLKRFLKVVDASFILPYVQMPPNQIGSVNCNSNCLHQCHLVGIQEVFAEIFKNLDAGFILLLSKTHKGPFAAI